MDKQWIAISTECSYIEDLLESGVTDIRNANYSRRGLYFQSFTNLSLGLERIGKVCLMIDYALDNNGNFPDQTFLKKNIGHDLLKLYIESKNIKTKRNFNFSFLQDLDQNFHQSILEILNDFAKGDRYHNFDLLLDITNKTNPISLWRSKIDKIIWDQKITRKRKNTIINNAQSMDKLVEAMSSVMFTNDDGNEIKDVFTGSFETGFFNAVAPYRQLFILQIIRYWHELISKLNMYNFHNNKLSIPFLSDYLRSFYNSDKYFLGRKRWDNVR